MVVEVAFCDATQTPPDGARLGNLFSLSVLLLIDEQLLEMLT